MKTYEVTISRTETYTVKANDRYEAEEIAFEMWDDGGSYSVETESEEDEE